MAMSIFLVALIKNVYSLLGLSVLLRPVAFNVGHMQYSVGHGNDGKRCETGTTRHVGLRRSVKSYHI